MVECLDWRSVSEGALQAKILFSSMKLQFGEVRDGGGGRYPGSLIGLSGLVDFLVPAAGSCHC